MTSVLHLNCAFDIKIRRQDNKSPQRFKTRLTAEWKRDQQMSAERIETMNVLPHSLRS